MHTILNKTASITQQWWKCKWYIYVNKGSRRVSKYLSTLSIWLFMFHSWSFSDPVQSALKRINWKQSFSIKSTKVDLYQFLHTGPWQVPFSRSLFLCRSVPSVESTIITAMMPHRRPANDDDHLMEAIRDSCVGRSFGSSVNRVPGLYLRFSLPRKVDVYFDAFE